MTIPFETNIEAARERKALRYAGLKSDIENEGYDVSIKPIEIGSRGFVSMDNIIDLQNLLNVKSKNSKDFKDLVKSLSKIAITASYCIFYSKFENCWLSPDLIEFD